MQKRQGEQRQQQRKSQLKKEEMLKRQKSNIHSRQHRDLRFLKDQSQNKGTEPIFKLNNFPKIKGISNLYIIRVCCSLKKNDVSEFNTKIIQMY